ncbi:MAG: two-component regulator propeller domain-containing protein, partial [Chitinophagales bacterium]
GCTTPQGLNRFDPATQKFKRYSDDSLYKKILPESYINFIFVDDENNLWLSSDGEGLFKFNPKTNEVRKFLHDSNDTTSLGENSPLTICKKDSDHLYVSMTYGFDILNTKTGKCRHVRVNKYESILGSVWSQECFLFKDHKDNLWIATLQGLKMFDPSTGKVITYQHQKGDPFSLSCDTVYSMCESPDGRMWVTTVGGGLNVFNPATQKFFHYTHSNTDPNSISTNNLSQILYHPSGKIWIQNDFVIDAVNLQPAKCIVFAHDEKNKNSVSDNNIGVIYRDRHDQTFVCSAKGLNLYDPLTKTFQLYQPYTKVNSIFRDSNVEIIYEDHENNYWVEADENKVVRYNWLIHDTKIFHTHEDQPDSLTLGYIWNFYEDKRGLMWMCGPSHACTYDPSTGKFTKHFPDPKHPSDLNGVGDFFSEQNGKMWTISLTGISYYDQQRDTFIHPLYRGHKAAEVLQKNWCIFSLAQDANKVWVGTMGQGLFYINHETGDCINISTRDGLPSDVVWGILKDEKQNLWIGTNNGICRFTPSKELLNLKNENLIQKGTFRNYGVADGIPVNEISNDLPNQTIDWQMLFALYADKGLIMFYPDSLKDNSFIPPVYLTKFSLFNKEVIPSDTNKFLLHTIEATKEITLSYRENVFSFSFAALNFVHPENNHYAYKLEGFDQDWIYTDASKRFANYTNLDAGDYTFMVKGSNNDGVWNETPATIRLIITPPFWKTIWFRAIMI